MQRLKWLFPVSVLLMGLSQSAFAADMVIEDGVEANEDQQVTPEGDAEKSKTDGESTKDKKVAQTKGLFKALKDGKGSRSFDNSRGRFRQARAVGWFICSLF